MYLPMTPNCTHIINNIFYVCMSKTNATRHSFSYSFVFQYKGNRQIKFIFTTVN